MTRENQTVTKKEREKVFENLGARKHGEGTVRGRTRAGVNLEKWDTQAGPVQPR